MSVRRRPLGLSAIVATCLAGVVLFSGTAASADVTYIYDELDRLVRVIRDTGEAATYQYDAVGNLLGITRATGVPSNTTVTSASSSNLLRGSCPTLTIIGFNFLGAVVTASSGITITSTQVQLDSLVVQVCVDAGATLGPGSITIQNDYGTATAPVAVWNPLVVTGISPTKAASGMVVTLTGSPFDPTAANNTVKVNGTPATVLTSTSTVLTFRVPAGATTGPVDVTTPTAYGPGAATLTVQTLGAARSQVPTADLLAYWSFDVDGRDNADSLDVTLQGGLTNGAGGILGAALDFPADPGRWPPATRLSSILARQTSPRPSGFDGRQRLASR